MLTMLDKMYIVIKVTKKCTCYKIHICPMIDLSIYAPSIPKKCKMFRRYNFICLEGSNFVSAGECMEGIFYSFIGRNTFSASAPWIESNNTNLQTHFLFGPKVWVEQGYYISKESERRK